MTIQDVKNDIVSRHIKPLYIFTGEEIEVIKIYRDKIANVLGSLLVYSESIKDIYSSLKMRTMFSQRICYYVLDDMEFLNMESTWDKLYSRLKYNTLIIQYSNIDKRSKFYKHFKEYIVEVEHLSDDVLAKYIKKELPEMSNENALLLIHACENDYSRVLSECNKIKCFAKRNNIKHDYAFYALYSNGIIHNSSKQDIFKFVNNVCNGGWDGKAEFDLLNSGESPIAILSLLYANFRNMLLVQLGAGRKDICDITGMTAWQVKCARNLIGTWTNAEIERILYYIMQTDRAIKCGEIDSGIALDYLLCKIFSI